MFIHLAVHHPFQNKTDPLIDSMSRFAKSMEGQPGLQQVFVLRDPNTGALVGLALWNSKEEWEAARPAMIEAVRDDPFDEWEPQSPDVFQLDVVWTNK
jgi:heme-degrading monooxygenase HmoA